MKILLTNDDGIHAPGLIALKEAFGALHDLTIVAPSDERSAASHSISLREKLYVQTYEENGMMHHAVRGTPVDCVKYAIAQIEGFKPDLVISGINQGSNTGVSVYYSGTIAAAREAVINRIPAMAVSLCDRDSRDFSAAVEMTGRLLKLYGAHKIPQQTILSVNVPALGKDEIAGVQMTKQADSRFVEEFISEEHTEDHKIYRLAGSIHLESPDGTSDEEAVLQKKISITPFKLDLTDYDALEFLRDSDFF